MSKENITANTLEDLFTNIKSDLILATNESGTTWVIRANPEKYELVAQNQLGDSGFASMAAVDGQLFVRTSTGDGAGRTESLYCLGQKKQP